MKHTDDLHQLPLPPLGVTIFRHKPQWAGEIADFAGLSFCRAVAEATAGAELWVDGGSIHVCQWSPVGLGLREPVAQFQKDLSPRLPFGIAGFRLAPLDRQRAGVTPDVVLVRGPATIIRVMAEKAGWDRAAWEFAAEDNLARSALFPMKSQRDGKGPFFLKSVNRVLGSLDKVPGWEACTAFAFRNRGISAGFEAIIKRYLSSMSVCRNSVVIPYLTGKFNISYFCAGGISWGGNYPFHVTSGWPSALWPEVSSILSW
ncbi:MAG: DUF169 domain-containing protein [Myxococcales bacterium]|nr:DUF169 domain-containing protein [Myxococcales bacterium]